MPSASETAPSESAQALRVFVVEDSPAIRDLLSEQLNDIPAVVVVGTAETEQAALDALRTTPCDVLLLDIKLRTGSGIGVLRALHGHADTGMVPATRIVFSNFAESEYRTLAARYGAQYFFDKSVGLVALLSLIRRLSSGEA